MHNDVKAAAERKNQAELGALQEAKDNALARDISNSSKISQPRSNELNGYQNTKPVRQFSQKSCVAANGEWLGNYFNLSQPHTQSFLYSTFINSNNPLFTDNDPYAGVEETQYMEFHLQLLISTTILDLGANPAKNPSVESIREQIMRNIDNGNPVVYQWQTGINNGAITQHRVTIVGYNLDSEGNFEVTIMNPGRINQNDNSRVGIFEETTLGKNGRTMLLYPLIYDPTFKFTRGK